ncbi:unnamed protein product [Amaranthus hypochondriacus]
MHTSQNIIYPSGHHPLDGLCLMVAKGRARAVWKLKVVLVLCGSLRSCCRSVGAGGKRMFKGCLLGRYGLAFG